MGKIISVVSGKGGTGKTTVSANLSVCLAKLGKRTLAVDCDFKMRNLDQHLGLLDSGVFDFHDVLTGKRALEDAIIPHSLLNLSFVPASNFYSFSDGGAMEGLKATVFSMKARFDFVIFDCPSGSDSPVPELSGLSDEVIVSVLPDLTSIRNAERIIGNLSLAGVRNFLLIVNRADVRLMQGKYCPNVDNVMDALNIPLLGVVYDEPGAIRYLTMGEPMSVDGSTIGAVCFKNIARRLCGERVPVLLI